MSCGTATLAKPCFFCLFNIYRFSPQNLSPVCPRLVPGETGTCKPFRYGHLHRFLPAHLSIFKKSATSQYSLKKRCLTPKRDVSHLQYCTAQYTIRQEIFTFAKAQRQPGFDLITRGERRVNTERAKTKGLRLQRSQAVDHLAGDCRDRPLFVCVMLGKYDQHEF